MSEDKKVAPAPKPAPKAAPTSDDYVVVAGKAVTSRKGIRGPGDIVNATMLAGGKSAIASLLEREVIVSKEDHDAAVRKAEAAAKKAAKNADADK